MARFYPSPPLSLHPDSLPFGRASSQNERERQTVTPPSSVTDGARLVPSHHAYPCSTIGNWTSPPSGSSETAMSHHHHHHYDSHPWKAPLYRPSSSPSDASSSDEEVPSLFPTFGVESSGWSSYLAAPSNPESKQVKPELGHFQESKSSLLWSRAPENQVYGGSLESGTYSVPSHIAAPYSTRPDTFKTACPTPRLPPPSLAFPSSSHCSLPSDKVKTHANRPGSHHKDPRPSPDDTGEEANSEAPYSCLIEKALLEAPDKKLTLQDIYSWFEKRTIKGRDRSSKGWQNSVRHNLSMNAAFEAIREEEPGKKAQNYWRLTEEAVKYGVQSTTRYRKQASNKKTSSADPPAPQRQRSGAKGGKATKIKIKLRGRPSGQDELRKEKCQRGIPQQALQKMIYSHGTLSSTTAAPTTTAVISSFHVSGPVTQLASESFDLNNVVGCAEAPSGASFYYDYDMTGSAPPVLPVAIGNSNMLEWGSLPSFSAGMMTAPGITADIHLGR
ncbi:uncharacterized protein BP01DRAFT_419103 [Aspergillus saccharolyticus JOP 1030-1]|uniref:Fork-head domain-containing protein n=1 Tax=Aspergillus saccharolyticus JOP 1030-1 TaxID=1450539 RepID=A0A318Z3B2_9EURO|nr:hypothetical protein BP01DRAFT_419103 [Aspergillus saccharolyticus JOP 1030-1]PYH40884.1 hypothetical protein BP01DRAFT_419103 [Aspergillus saccharolyticus JOP 1030-1]